MSYAWVQENPSEWDAGKTAIISAAPDGIFDTSRYGDGGLLPGEWWRAEDAGKLIGYGWMDCTWGEGEVLLAVDPAFQGRGVGTFILDQLEREAASRHLEYIVNVVRPTHPSRAEVTGWLQARGFQHAHDDDRLVRRVRS